MTDDPKSYPPELIEELTDLADQTRDLPQNEHPVIFDPFFDPSDEDPNLARLRELSGYSASATPLDIDSLANRTGVLLLLNNHRISVLQLREAQTKIANLEHRQDALSTQHNNLRVTAATLLGQSQMTILEIPFSVVSGIAINMLNDSNTGNNYEAIALLVVALAAVLFIRKVPLKSLLPPWRRQ